MSPDDNLPFEAHVNRIRTPGVAVGQDAAIALADVIKCVVIIHIAFLELQLFRPKYMPITSPIQLAFFEPGLFMAVMPRLYELLRPPE